MTGCASLRSTVKLLLYSTLVAPGLPRLVVMTIAPLAASMPYRAEASGPFSTVSVSMSSGFRSAARLVKSTPRLLSAVLELWSDASTPVFIVLLSSGSPSTIISGWLLPLMELTPRITIDAEAPGTPDVLVTSTPAIRPCSALTKFSRCVCAISGPRTVCCDQPRARCSVVCPRAVTTTASRLIATRRSWTSMTSASATVRSTGAVPINRNCSTCPAVAPSEYAPWLFVAVLFPVPLTATVTPASGAPCSLVTVPVMVLCCANARGATRSIPTNSVTARLAMMTATGFLGDEPRRYRALGKVARHSRSLLRPRSEQVRQVRGAVHDRLVGRIISHVVVVHDEAGVERGVLVPRDEPDAPQLLEDRAVHGPVPQPPCELQLQRLRDHRVRRPRVVAAQPDDHRHAPGIGAEQPVQRRGLVLEVARIAGHAPKEERLLSERGEQFVRAPDERNPDPKAVVSAARHRVEAAPVVLGHEAPGAVRPQAPDLVVAVVVPGIPLVVPRRILSHPRSHRLLRGVLERGVEIRPLPRQPIELSGAELHVVHPVVLLIEVRRAGGRRLTHAGMRGAERVHHPRAPGEPVGERAVVLAEHSGAERKRGRVFSRRRREAGGAVLVLEEPLRLPGAGVHRARPASSPSIVRRVVGGQVPKGVVAVVPQLVQERVVFGIHLEQPGEPPARLVQHVGDAVRAGKAIRLKPVGERLGVIPVGEQQHGGRVRRGRAVLQVVRRVGPSAGDRNELAAACRMIHQHAVAALMHGVSEHRVVARALLPQIGEERVRRAPIHVVRDPQRERARV